MAFMTASFRWWRASVTATNSCSIPREVFEDSIFEAKANTRPGHIEAKAKAKARPIRGQVQGQGQAT